MNSLGAKSSEVKSVLSIQLKKEGDGKRKGLNALFFIADTILVNSGYKQPTKHEMKERIKDVFGFYPPESDSLISYIYKYDNECINGPLRGENGELIDIINDDIFVYRSSSSPIYISYEYHLITFAYYLPEIIDYQKLFPELSVLEEKPIYFEDEYEEGVMYEETHWKDEPDLGKRQKYNKDFLIHLNKYIFNDSNASLTWLMINGADFLEFLVKDFGYVKDKKQLKWVLDKNKFHYDYYENNLEDFSRILAARTCDGKLIFHKEVLDIMSENLSEDYLSQISDCVRFLGTMGNNSKFTSTFSFSERAEFLAKLLYWGENTPKGDEYGWYQFQFMGVFYKFNDNRDKYDKEFEKQNYYNLLDFKEMWEEAKEVGDGMSLPIYE